MEHREEILIYVECNIIGQTRCEIINKSLLSSFNFIFQLNDAESNGELLQKIIMKLNPGTILICKNGKGKEIVSYFESCGLNKEYNIFAFDRMKLKN